MADAVSPEPEPPVAAQPAAPDAAPAVAAQPAAPAAPAWTPPDTFSDRFSRWSTAAVRYSVAALGLLSLVLGVLWVVPTIAVSTSDSYRVACEGIAREPTFEQYVGAPVVCERIPTWYHLGQSEGDQYRISARGPGGRVLAEVWVKGGQARVTGFYISD